MPSDAVHLCPSCGKQMAQIRGRGGGYHCNTQGCDIHRIWFTYDGKITRIIRSAVPKNSMKAIIQKFSDMLLYDEGILLVNPLQ